MGTARAWRPYLAAVGVEHPPVTGAAATARATPQPRRFNSPPAWGPVRLLGGRSLSASASAGTLATVWGVVAAVGLALDRRRVLASSRDAHRRSSPAASGRARPLSRAPLFVGTRTCWAMQNRRGRAHKAALASARRQYLVAVGRLRACGPLAGPARLPPASECGGECQPPSVTGDYRGWASPWLPSARSQAFAGTNAQPAPEGATCVRISRPPIAVAAAAWEPHRALWAKQWSPPAAYRQRSPARSPARSSARSPARSSAWGPATASAIRRRGWGDNLWRVEISGAALAAVSSQLCSACCGGGSGGGGCGGVRVGLQRRRRRS